MKRTHPHARRFTNLGLASAVLFVATLFPTPALAGDGDLTAGRAIPPARTKIGRSGQVYHWKPGC